MSVRFSAVGKWVSARVSTATFLLIVIIGITLLVSGCRHTKGNSYDVGEVKRGDIVNIISCSGQMEPVGTVEVGTQVSGRIERVLVDYNSKVQRGQLLAVLDTTTLAQQVRDAEAALAKAQGQYNLTQSNFNYTSELAKQSLVSDYELEQAKVALISAEAAKQSAEVALARARTNLKYAFVYSPIDGTVISRNVEPGQTVAASLSAPTLFVIAQDLSRMRILAQVDESDIGKIDSGLAVKFTVQAYPDKEFSGTTVQLRLQPSTVSNVVTYTVVVDAPNEDNLLLPGMTATVNFYVQERHNVLMVPNSALKLRPTQKMINQFRKNRAAREADSVRPRRGEQDESSNAPSGTQMGTNIGQVWYLDNQGHPQMVLVHTGVTDGRNTEVIPVQGELKEGMKILLPKSSGTSTKSSSSFGPPPGGFGGPMFR